MAKITSVCVYCGSQGGKSGLFTDSAALTGRILAESGVRLVYGGGTNGQMGAVAKGCQEAGGKVTGIIPEFLLAHEANHEPSRYCDEVVVTETMHERKHRMFDSADAFLALPGGIGTLEELIEMMTWAQLGRHTKPIAILDVEGFWAPLQSLLAHMEDAGFLHSATRAKPHVMQAPQEIEAWLTGSHA